MEIERLKSLQEEEDRENRKKAALLKGKQVIVVCNFAEKNIAGIVSQVLILGSIDKEGKVILVHPSQKSENGLSIA